MKNTIHAQFTGTIQDYHHFIGPRIKNKICNFTRKNRNTRNGICEHCNTYNKELDSAHIHGKGRRQIIEKVLYNYLNNKIVIIPSLETVEIEILKLHKPIENVVKFLCKKCHNEYDNNIIETRENQGKNLTIQIKKNSKSR